jgi:Fe2+ or Zn2+ uptake regulation protein
MNVQDYLSECVYRQWFPNNVKISTNYNNLQQLTEKKFIQTPTTLYLLLTYEEKNRTSTDVRIHRQL